MTEPPAIACPPHRGEVLERITLTGELDPGGFLPWIERHARKLGLSHATVAISRHRIELDVTGGSELIEMLAIGCSLGPIGVWVETVDRRSGSSGPRP